MEGQTKTAQDSRTQQTWMPKISEPTEIGNKHLLPSFINLNRRSLILIGSWNCLLLFICFRGCFFNFIGTIILEPNKQISIHQLNKKKISIHVVQELWQTQINTCMSEVHRVRLSRRSCMIKVLSLYDSSPRVSNSAIASSKA